MSLVYRKSLFVTSATTTSSSSSSGSKGSSQPPLVPRDGRPLPCLLYGYVAIARASTLPTHPRTYIFTYLHTHPFNPPFTLSALYVVTRYGSYGACIDLIYSH